MHLIYPTHRSTHGNITKRSLHHLLFFVFALLRFQNRRMKHKKQVRRQLQNTSGSPLSEGVDEDECCEDNDIDVVSDDECYSNNSSSK